MGLDEHLVFHVDWTYEWKAKGKVKGNGGISTLVLKMGKAFDAL